MVIHNADGFRQPSCWQTALRSRWMPAFYELFCIWVASVFSMKIRHSKTIHIRRWHPDGWRNKMKAHPKKKRHQCEKPIYALDVPRRCINMETSLSDRANGSSSARCGKQAARTPHKSEKCNVGRSSIGTGCRLSLLGCGYPFCWKPRRIRGSWVPTFVDSSPSYIYIYTYTHTHWLLFTLSNVRACDMCDETHCSYVCPVCHVDMLLEG